MTRACDAPPVVDGRHQRIDYQLTIGEPWATEICVTDTDGMPLDLTGAVVEAGLLIPGEADFDLLPTVNLSAGCISLSISGEATEEEPLGLGTWTWYLRVKLPNDSEPSYWVGGNLSIYRIASYADPDGGCADGDVTVCVGSTINVSIDVCTGSQGPAGGQAHVGPLPPVNLAPGMIWVMTPSCHTAIYTPCGWKPIWPQENNDAVEAGDALVVDGLWVAT